MKIVKSFARSFRRFLEEGDVVSVGVAFVLGASSKSLIDAIAGDGTSSHGVVGGLVIALFGGSDVDATSLGPTVNGTFIPLGGLISAFGNFVMTAAVLFALVRLYERYLDGDVTTDSMMLAEIRDTLRELVPAAESRESDQADADAEATADESGPG